MEEHEAVYLTEQDFKDIAAEAGIYKNVAGHLFNILSGRQNPAQRVVEIDPLRGELAVPTEALVNAIQTPYLYRVGKAGRELLSLAYSQYHVG